MMRVDCRISMMQIEHIKISKCKKMDVFIIQYSNSILRYSKVLILKSIENQFENTKM